jgi:hypothetical protein
MKAPIQAQLTALMLVFLAGCRRTPPTDYVVLPDISQSIERDGILDEFRAIDGLIDRMQRGDSLTIIPITGNAMSETPGHVLRFTAPTERQAYDHDLVVFREQAHQSIHAIQDAAFANPSKHTDILGALDIAGQELETFPPYNMKSLIVMSDFVEDDDIYRFTVDKALADPATAKKLAGHLQTKHAFTPHNVHISLDGLQSKDLRSIGPLRQLAVREFWKEYLCADIRY